MTAVRQKLEATADVLHEVRRLLGEVEETLRRTALEMEPAHVQAIADLRQLVMIVITDDKALRDPERVRTTLADLDKGLQRIAAPLPAREAPTAAESSP